MNLSNLVLTPINDIGHIFGASHWISIFALVFFFVVTIVVTILIKKLGKTKATYTSFIIAAFGAVFFAMMYSSYPPTLNSAGYSWYTETTAWMSIFSSTFIGALCLIIPFYIFFVISNIFIKTKKTNINKRIYAYGISGFIGSKAFGSIVAFSMIPLIILVSVSFTPPTITVEEINKETIPNWIVAWSPYVVNWFTNIYLIIASIAGGLCFGLFLKFKTKNKEIKDDKTIEFVFVVNKLLQKSFAKISYLIPYLIATKFSLVFTGEPISYLPQIGMLILIYFLGFIIIMAISTIVSIISMRGKNRMKRYFKTASKLWLTSFINRNSIITIPSTVLSGEELGVRNEIVTFVSTFGSLSALIMCSGFFPALLVLFTVINFGTLDAATLVITFFTILIVSFGSFGLGSSDLMVVVTTLGVLGFSDEIIEWISSLTVVMLILLESFNIVGDVVSHLCLAIMLERNQTKHDHKKTIISRLLPRKNDIF